MGIANGDVSARGVCRNSWQARLSLQRDMLLQGNFDFPDYQTGQLRNHHKTRAPNQLPCDSTCLHLAHQNRTIAIASDFRVDGAKSPEIPQKEGVLDSEIAATFHRTLKSQCSIAFYCLRNRAISGVRDGHHNRKSQKSLRFRCAKCLHLLTPVSS